MRLCFFLSDITKVGGIERVTSTLVNQFVSYSEFTIEIVSMFKGREIPNYSIHKNVQIHYLVESAHGAKPHSIKRALNMFANILSVRRFFKRAKYDVVIAQSFPPALIMFFSGFPYNKIIAAEHVYAEYYSEFLQKIRDFIYRRFSKVVVLTSSDKMFFKKRGLDDKVMVIPNPVIFQKRKVSKLDMPRILAVGRLVYQKGFENLITGFVCIHKKYPNWILDIYGEGPMRCELEQQIKDLNLQGVVNLKGLSDRIPEELSNSSIFVLSSRFEGFPMVLIEAMNQGVPCVAYDCPNGPSDIVKHGFNGLLVENQNLDKFIAQIEYLIKNESERLFMGGNAPESVSCFSERIVVSKWIELLKSYGK